MIWLAFILRAVLQLASTDADSQNLVENTVIGLTNQRTIELADGALRTASAYLTKQTAYEHALAATVAGATYNIDPALLLSIAWHESRYEVTAVSHEVGGKVSCGSMTPEPVTHCPAPSMLGGYLAGAKHLRMWLDVERGNLQLALTGYAGGGRLISFCAAGGDSRGCRVARVFLVRAAWIASPSS